MLECRDIFSLADVLLRNNKDHAIPMYHQEAGEVSEVKRTQLDPNAPLCNPCTRLPTSQACIQKIHHSQNSGHQQSRLQARRAQPILGYPLALACHSPHRQVDFSSFCGRLFLLVLPLRTPFTGLSLDLVVGTAVLADAGLLVRPTCQCGVHELGL